MDRAHSNWTHLWSAGLEPEGDFLRACALEDRRAARGWAPFWRYLDLGRYGGQLDRLYRTVPREQVLVLRYRDLRERPVETLDVIFGFLGVQTGVVDAVPAENVTTHVTDSPRNRVISGALRVGARLGTDGWRPPGSPAATGSRGTCSASRTSAAPWGRTSARPCCRRSPPTSRCWSRSPGTVRRLARPRARPAAAVAPAPGQDRHRLPEHRRPVRRADRTARAGQKETVSPGTGEPRGQPPDRRRDGSRTVSRHLSAPVLDVCTDG